MNKKIARYLLVMGSILATSNVIAEMVADISPYIGIDYNQIWMKAKGNYDIFFPKSFPAGSVYVGTKFHENFAIELGYDTSKKRQKDWSVSTHQAFFNGTANLSYSGTTKIRRSGGHIDLVGFLPTIECFDLIALVGFGWVQAKIESTFSNTASPSASALSSLNSKGKGVFRVGVGGSYMITEMVGIRAKLSWESTSALRVSGNPAFTDFGMDPKAFKGTTALTTGAFVKF